MAFNSVQLMGRFSATPELVQAGQTQLTNFTLAVDKPFNKEHDHPEANWIDCIAFGKTAEFVVGHFEKGSRVLVEGRLDTSNYEDKQGNKRKSTKVVVSNVHFVESKKDAEGTTAGYSPSPTKQSTMNELSSFENIPEEDLPF